MNTTQLRLLLAAMGSGVALNAAGADQAPDPSSLKALEPAAKAPAFKSGMRVVDPAGRLVGEFESLARSTLGPLVVLQIEGKLVSVPQSILKLDGEQIRSAQTKAEILSTTDAPR